MSKNDSLGVVPHPDSSRPTDYLFRVSIKCLIRDADGKVLVVKEAGRTWWDLPGGGMDHGEDIRTTIVRELSEEVGLRGDFAYRIIDVDEPIYLDAHDFWQLRLVFAVTPAEVAFVTGADADDVAFLDPNLLASSESEVERRIARYAAVG